MASAMGAVIRRLHAAAAAQPPRLTKLALDAPKSDHIHLISKDPIVTSSFWAVVDFELATAAQLIDISSSLQHGMRLFAAGGGTIYVSSCILVEVEFADGSSFHLSAEFLRVYSPAADSKIRSVGGEKVIFRRRHVGIMSAESVGNYGIRILFDDLHKTGIFTWDYLHHLGSNKFSLMRNYIRTLRKHGLSRDPQPRK